MNGAEPSSRGPSRDVFGGPWLGVIAFLVVAVLLGWGLISLFRMQLAQTTHELSRDELEHGFDPATVYTLKRDLLIGKTSIDETVLFPDRDGLPRHAPNRRAMPTADELRTAKAAIQPGQDDPYPDLLGVVNRGTRVRFEGAAEDLSNSQTRVVVQVVLLDGPFADDKPVRGMHLESADTVNETGGRRYIPRADLFEAEPVAEGSAADQPIQSDGPPADPP